MGLGKTVANEEENRRGEERIRSAMQFSSWDDTNSTESHASENDG